MGALLSEFDGMLIVVRLWPRVGGGVGLRLGNGSGDSDLRWSAGLVGVEP